jgi:hypothetical protein
MGTNYGCEGCGRSSDAHTLMIDRDSDNDITVDVISLSHRSGKSYNALPIVEEQDTVKIQCCI